VAGPGESHRAEADAIDGQVAPMVTVPLAAAGCEVGSRVTRRVLSSLERMIR